VKLRLPELAASYNIHLLLASGKHLILTDHNASVVLPARAAW